MLRTNQKNAVEISLENNFKSGVHFHATGTGKSWIAMNIIAKYNEINNEHNIMWICERKSILIEQFESKNIKDRNFSNIIKKFNILNFSKIKIKDWYNSVNTSIYWNKPVLLIINRAFLVSSEKYKKINIPIHLIIHDECHTIINKTTKEFYNYILNLNTIPKCIGFSATPNLLSEPFNNILTSYSIYDAFIDNIICPPKIKWFSSSDIINPNEIVILIKNIINNSNIIYKKLIVWCGMINYCKEMANLWKTHFNNFLICIDTSKNIQGYLSYNDFRDADKNAILFCASKHREGSDIKNLDCCIFLDKVEDRSSKVFVQSIGRVLRLDKNNLKKFGLIIDINAKNSFSICNNLHEYLNLPEGIFPWKYNYKLSNINDKLIKINSLKMNITNNTLYNDSLILNSNESDILSIDYLKNFFIRNIPDSDIYKNRLDYELNLLYNKNLISHLIQAIDILKITKNLPHVTRGSCGSSLICYLLGISHIDPVLHNIKFSRFLNNFRNNLPDIDLDFPHNLRDEVFLKIELKWPGKVARISNHVYYHDKSAIRQAIRNAGIHKFIPKSDIYKEINSLHIDQQLFIHNEKLKLENTFKCYSLHCGGIVYYPNGVPDDLLLKKNLSSIKQIKLNKNDIASDKNFKIDILSSRAISQLYEIYKFRNINFEEYQYDENTFKLLQNGDNIGITLAESPLIRKAFIKIKPKTIYDIAICLSIIRPAAKNAKYISEINNDDIIFDDDAIDIISKFINVSEDEADKYRRAFSKGDKKSIEEFKHKISNLEKSEQKEIMTKLSNLSRYSFCKSHALSYAQLVYKLAYMKANNLFDFWKATLNNCQSSYRKWVHLYEGRLAGVDVYNSNLKKDDVSIYAKNRRKKLINYNVYDQLRLYGYWNMINDDFFPNCYFIKKDNLYIFNGIIASNRIKFYNKTNICMIFIGVDKHKYIQVNINNIKYIDSKKIGIKGSGYYNSELDELCNIITCDDYVLY